MWPSATPATWNEGGCHQVLRLPRKVPRRHRRPRPPQARHQSQPSAVSATPATQSAGGRHQVPRLPRETKVHVAKCHACATPATQNTAHVKDGVWQSCMWKMVCVKDGVWQMVCERWWVTKLFVKDGVWQSCVWKMVCDNVWEAEAAAEEEEEEAGYRIKNKNPTQRCGEKWLIFCNQDIHQDHKWLIFPNFGGAISTFRQTLMTHDVLPSQTWDWMVSSIIQFTQKQLAVLNSPPTHKLGNSVCKRPCRWWHCTVPGRWGKCPKL